MGVYTIYFAVMAITAGIFAALSINRALRAFNPEWNMYRNCLVSALWSLPFWFLLMIMLLLLSEDIEHLVATYFGPNGFMFSSFFMLSMAILQYILLSFFSKRK